MTRDGKLVITRYAEGNLITKAVETLYLEKVNCYSNKLFEDIRGKENKNTKALIVALTLLILI